MSKKSTTHDLVELVRRNFEALSRRDFDAVESFFAKDAVYGPTEIGTFEGAPAIRGLCEDLMTTYDEFHIEIEEIVDLGNGVTFAVIILTAHPLGSSGEVRMRYATVAIWTDCVIERQTDHTDIDEARAAAERLAEERR
jgi:ketosteroid isomerase-like protein